ncbi:MAG: prepilin-type N-terminal cleavage/methylation domain-containing protein [Colwellia sp.]|nr:prepilin-type N-terminal cleavage/methylation domain-containing protein [Colwellia sp.]
MKNLTQSIKKKQTGFTLLELVVVVAVMGLISTMAMDVYTDKSNQTRFEATKARLAEIKFAIIGDPQMRVGSQAVLTGYYNDMSRLPETLSELIYQCRTSSNVGVIATDSATCAAAGNTWEASWEGPYLHNLQSSGGNLIFRDAWGNSSTDGNFGWLVTSATETFTIQSSGLGSGSSEYEADYPSTGDLITKADLDRINHLKGLITSSGYCIDTSDITAPIEYTIDLNYLEQATCDAETDRSWAAFP